MPPYEYRILKMPLNEQDIYNNLMSSFGWQIQSMQEMVDHIESSSSATNNSSIFGQGNATIRNPTGRYTYVSANGYSRQTGSQEHKESTKVHTLLSVTYMRDLAMPNYSQLAALGQQCLNAYLQHRASESWELYYRWQYLYRKGQNILMGPQVIQPSVRFNRVAAKHFRHKYEGGTSDLIQFDLFFNIYNCSNRHCEVKLGFTDSAGRSIDVPNTSCFIRPTQNENYYELKDGKGINGGLFKEFKQEDRYGEIQYCAYVIDITNDMCIARSGFRKFSYSKSLFGKLEIKDLISTPVETIGRLPQAVQSVKAPAASAEASLIKPLQFDPKGKFKTFKIICNIERDGNAGVLAETTFELFNCKDVLFFVRLVFNRKSSGICASNKQEYKPVLDIEKHSMSFFTPYKELKLPDGEHIVEVYIEISDFTGKLIKKSKINKFNLLRSGRSDNANEILPKKRAQKSDDIDMEEEPIPANGKFNEVKVFHNEQKNGSMGIIIRTIVHIENRKNIRCRLSAYTDSGKYKLIMEELIFITPNDDVVDEEFDAFLSYSDLSQGLRLEDGAISLKTDLCLRDSNHYDIAETSLDTFILIKNGDEFKANVT